ncbi:trypsin-like serine protease [Leptolyngbya sp. FACHB-261]|uniref:trypsin-like serine protease n=1 Tax=Leptolyngbya sp. FACHB-261 TaxID=2692806 RepID=UPI00168230E4|nr:trypsin-like serine protease [Leptolyngbya sp. FACHB-261]MBD2102347.1 trypsin-like serine protease [Leptolyngbya sp. FACHB-261]
MLKLFPPIGLSAAITTIALFSGPSTSVEAATLSSKLEPNLRQPRYVTAGQPANYIVNSGTGFDGVVELFIGSSQGDFNCSGSLLTSGLHILTAAHCLTDNFGTLIVNDASVFFDLPTGPAAIEATNFFVHPDWDGFADVETFGGDIAIVQLASAAPSNAERYNIYRQTDEIGKVGTKVGYGLTGTGFEGDTISDGAKRSGQNIYDASGEVFGGILPNAVLAYDFDNGSATNDAFGVSFGIADLGLGLNEINSASGDSGGPTLIKGLIAGVTSFGFGAIESDVDSFTNSSFGEFSGDTRVSTYASWIDSILTPDNHVKVPESSNVRALLLTCLLTAFASMSRRPKTGH